MKIITRFATSFVAGLLVLSSTGCATYRTISEAEMGSAKVFSGTRLDIRAMGGEVNPTNKFKATPPLYPVIDLPFSIAMDILLLPLTTPTVIYEYIFE